MNQKQDSYGTQHREELMRSMEQPAKAAGRTDWKPYNRREPKTGSAMSFVVGWLVVAVVFAVAVAQIAMRYGWHEVIR